MADLKRKLAAWLRAVADRLNPKPKRGRPRKAHKDQPSLL